MQQSEKAEAQQASTGTQPVVGPAGLYVYCVAPGSEGVTPGETGIEGRAVYTVAQEGICALVHDCPAQPYETGDGGAAADWVMAHHRVVEAVWRRWGTVLPMSFNTIVRAGGGGSAAESLRTWLKAEQESLKGRLDLFRGKVEYGVQVSWDPAVIARQIAEASPEARELEEEVRSRPRGAGYMYRQKLERALKREMEARASEEFRTLYAGLRRVTENVRVERAREGEGGHQVLLNLSCLISAGRSSDLERELDGICTREGYFARLIGPMPPYSFC